MTRLLLILAVVAVAFTVYAAVDLALTPAIAARGFPKPLWAVVVVLLPPVGGVLWLLVGHGPDPFASSKGPPSREVPTGR